MKKFQSVIVLLAFLFLANSLSAQEATSNRKARIPRWSCHKGYWVIESSVKEPKKSTVFFYSDDHVLVYKEKVEGMALNTNKRKTLMKLKRALDKVVTDWETSGRMKADNELLALQPKRNH